MNSRTRPTALLIILLATLTCAGAEVPGPLPGTFVHDFAGVIPADQEAEIQAKARRLRDEYQTEIAVVTVSSLEGEESFDYSMRMARSWGIGSKDKDIRGLLILVAVRDRKTAFRTSRHIEGELPDSVTGEISRLMSPYFKNGDFGGGLSLGLDQILARLQTVYEPRPVAARTAAPGLTPTLWWLPFTAAFIGLTSVGLIGFVFFFLKRTGREAEAARRAANGGGFRAWAAAKDPSPVPKPNRKSQSITRAGSRAKGKGKGSARSTAGVSNYGSESSSSSSSYDSSSSSYDSGSSSGYDSGSSYSGGSDFGGGGSDSSW